MLTDDELRWLMRQEPDTMVGVSVKDLLKLYHGFYVAVNVLQEFSVAKMEADQEIPGVAAPVFVEMATVGQIVKEADDFFGITRSKPND